MQKQEAVAESPLLVAGSKICLLGTNAADGFANIKAMMNLRHQGMKTIWFSTNASSRRVSQLARDNRACVYYVDDRNFKGLMLTGTIELLDDHESRQLLWSEGAERYYPLGLDDSDYTVLRFTAVKANYYHKLENVTFDVQDAEAL